MSKKEKEIVKPENYQEGGMEKMFNFMWDNILSYVFILSTVVWLVLAIGVTIKDMINGNINLIVVTFITSLTVGVFLQIRKILVTKKNNPKPKKEKSCGKCGNK